MTTYRGQAETDIAAADVSRLAEELTVCLVHAHLIESDVHTKVYHGVWQNRDVVLRQYNHVGLIHSLCQTLAGSQAHRAWTASHRLLNLRIRTARPVAYIEQRRGPLLWQSWSVMELVDRPSWGEVLCDESVPEGCKRRLIQQTVRLVDRLAARGISCRQIKRADVLCDAKRIMLANPENVTIHRFGCLPWLWRAGDITRFLCDAGLERERGLPEPMFLEVRRAGGRLWVSRDLQNRELEEVFWGGSPALGRQFELQPVQSSVASCVCRFQATVNSVPTTIYLKEYLDRSIWDLLKHMLRPSRAVRAMRASQMLSRHRFQTPQVVAVGNLRHNAADSKSSTHRLRTSRCFMATCEVADAVPIHTYLMPVPGEPAPCTLRERRELLRQFGLTVGRMHREGIAHGDLRSGNVLVCRREHRWEFFLIDNERTREYRYLSHRLRRKNLVQVNLLPWGISNTDRLRFFLPYLLVNPSVRPRRRQYARKIMAITRKRLLSLKKRGRLDHAIRVAGSGREAHPRDECASTGDSRSADSR